MSLYTRARLAVAVILRSTVAVAAVAAGTVLAGTVMADTVIANAVAVPAASEQPSPDRIWAAAEWAHR